MCGERKSGTVKTWPAVMELIHIKSIHHHLFYWILVFLLLSSSPLVLRADPETPIYRVDPLALLSGTLRTYQRAGCDRELVTLSCPRGTSISIEVAQYGQSGDANEQSLCPVSTDDSIEISLPGTEIEIKAPESCTWPNALQYSLLQTVVEACQKKRHCKFLASPKTFGGDPCPGHRKFVEVAYKCRPYEFRSKIACENDVIQLICNPYSRIAIYSASFGRTEYESLQCSQPQGVKEETCLASYATETVMQKCHGRRKCTLSADSTTFGKPCRPDSRMYLKVVYTCVPRKVLKDRFEAAPEPDEPLQSDLEQDHDDLYDEDQFFRESDALPPGPAPKLQGGPSNNRVSDIPGYMVTSSTPPMPPRSIQDYNQDNDFSFEESVHRRVKPLSRNYTPLGPIERGSPTQSLPKGQLFFATPTPTPTTEKLPEYKDDKVSFEDHNQSMAHDNNKISKNIGTIAMTITAKCTELFAFFEKHQEKFYIYLIVAVAVAILLCLSIVVGRVALRKRRTVKENDKFQTSNTGETTLPNGFTDDISEIDADIDLQTPLPVPSVSRSDSYGAYTPSPGPYGNLGPSNISHTSTTMLVPPCSMGSMMNAAPPASYLSGPINIIPSQLGQSIGGIRTPMAAISTLPRHPQQQHQPPVFLGGAGSVIGHSQTLRRPSSDLDGNTPRSISRGAANTQFYYG